MVQKIGISVPDWLFEEIEHKRGAKNRSEFIGELITKALGFRGGRDEGENHSNR